MKKNSGKGGRRKNAGRKSTGVVPIRHVRIRRWDDIPGKNKSRFINEAIERALDHSILEP